MLCSFFVVFVFFTQCLVAGFLACFFFLIFSSILLQWLLIGIFRSFTNSTIKFHTLILIYFAKKWFVREPALPVSIDTLKYLIFFSFFREVYKYAYSSDGSLTGYVNNSLSYFNVQDFSQMALPKDPFLNLPYNKSFCRSVNSCTEVIT